MSPESAPDDCAAKLKALADPTRYAVVRALLEGPACVGDLVVRLDVEQSLLSHHLKVLRDHGIVTAARDGRQVRYGVAGRVEPRGGGTALWLGCCELSFPPV